MKKFLTSYKQGSGKYGSHIYAKSYKQAEQIAMDRNIGEKVVGVSSGAVDGYNRKVPEDISNPDFKDLSDFEFLHALPQILHSACFLSFIAVSSNQSTLQSLIGDEGVIHELIHLLNGSNVNMRSIAKARKLFRELQSKVPENFNNDKKRK